MTWQLIDQATLSSAAASITFSDVGGYQFYRVSAFWVFDGSTAAIDLRLNSDDGANYAYQRIQATATTITGGRSTGQTAQRLTPASPFGGTSNSGTLIIAKPGTSLKAQTLAHLGIHQEGANPVLELQGGEWNNTAAALSAISFLKSSGSFAANTSILVEGLST